MAKQGTHTGRQQTMEPPMVVEPRWLLKAALVMLLVAFVCGYVTLCWLFYQGQWQLVLHPVRTTARPATIGGRPYELVRFGPDASGLPQRTAWWMAPSATDAYRHLVVLYLPSGDGSLNDATAMLDGLRRLGIAVFAVNYRGYGESAAGHPTEARMREDAEAAWTYLVQERKVNPAYVVPFGSGVGAALALGLAEEHKQTSVLIMNGPRFDVVKRVKADPRVRFLPVEWLLHDRFALEPGIEQSKLPKLIFSKASEESANIAKAGDPKMTVEMPGFEQPAFDQVTKRFLDAYAPPTPLSPLAPQAATK